MNQNLSIRTLSRWLAAGLLLAAVSCTTDSPSEPRSSAGPPPGSGGGGGATTFNVTVTLQPATVPAGSEDPVLVTVRAVRADNGQPAGNGTPVSLFASQGSFGTPGGSNQLEGELVNGALQVQFFPPTDQARSISIQATVAGSVGTATLLVQEAEAFFVSFVDPNFGSTAGGDTVTVHGNGFEAPARVTFGGVNARVLSVSPTSIRVITPESPSGPNTRAPVPVTVTVNVNQADEASDTLAGAFTFSPGGTTPDQPAVFSVTPATGPNEGGTHLVIVGQGFQAPVRVQFCSPTTGDCVEATLNSVGPQRLEVVTPAATGFGSGLRNSTVNIVITNLESGLSTTAEGAFRYGIVLEVTGIQPDTVDAESPGNVNIIGKGFEAPLLVLIDDKSQAVLSVTGSQITFRPAPFQVVGCPAPGAVVHTSAPVVRLLSNDAEATSPVSLKFVANIPRPQVVSVNPNSGTAAGNTLVTVTGSGFDTPVRVLFGGNAATVSSTTSTSIQARTPAFTGDFPTEACTATGNVPGTRKRPAAVDVSVTNLGTTCSDTLPGGFVYQPDTACVPNEAPAQPECNDGIDNDLDGLTDFPNDPECNDANDNTEGI